ncbi:MAG TPA: twin-arginine translocation signal domain-containing protein, partial [Blastocatellia bacterium]|nr:twin-arginine translocation signal domain-containing protein [Blastocatellia bacterium]
MSNEENGNNSVGRRNFLRGAALAGVSAPLLAGETMAAPQSAKAIGKARPVVISSANINKGPDGSVFNGGIDCVSKAMEILKRGGDTLEAVVAG